MSAEYHFYIIDIYPSGLTAETDNLRNTDFKVPKSLLKSEGISKALSKTLEADKWRVTRAMLPRRDRGKRLFQDSDELNSTAYRTREIDDKNVYDIILFVDWSTGMRLKKSNLVL